MKPAWYAKLPHWGQEAIDQGLHFTAGFLISAVAGPIVSIVVACIRELVQNWGDDNNDYLDMMIDMLVWTLGAIAASLVF